jgi:molecular chaperone GrpE
MVKKTKEKEIKKDELTEMKGLLLRVQADFENYRKRTQAEKEAYGKFLNTDLVLRVLPVLDNFKLALKHQPKEIEGNPWTQGVWQIERQLEQILLEEGVSEIPAEGQKFNHHLHEAIEEVESEKPPGTVAEVVNAGYMMGDKVIRHAKVKVVKIKKGDKHE